MSNFEENGTKCRFILVPNNPLHILGMIEKRTKINRGRGGGGPSMSAHLLFSKKDFQNEVL